MRLIFRFGLLYKLAVWDNSFILNKEAITDMRFFIDMDDEAVEVGVDPIGDNTDELIKSLSVYTGPKFCTSDQLEHLSVKMKNTDKKL